MSTALTKPVCRVTPNRYSGRQIILTIAPAGGAQAETILELRLKGTRTGYTLALSDLYRLGALWHGQKEKRARSEARKAGIPWREAKRRFARSNRISRVVNVIRVGGAS